MALVVYDFENRLPPNPMVKCYFWVPWKKAALPETTESAPGPWTEDLKRPEFTNGPTRPIICLYSTIHFLRLIIVEESYPT